MAVQCSESENRKPVTVETMQINSKSARCCSTKGHAGGACCRCRPVGAVRHSSRSSRAAHDDGDAAGQRHHSLQREPAAAQQRAPLPHRALLAVNHVHHLAGAGGGWARVVLPCRSWNGLRHGSHTPAQQQQHAAFWAAGHASHTCRSMPDCCSVGASSGTAISHSSTWASGGQAARIVLRICGRAGGEVGRAGKGAQSGVGRLPAWAAAGARKRCRQPAGHAVPPLGSLPSPHLDRVLVIPVVQDALHEVAALHGSSREPACHWDGYVAAAGLGGCHSAAAPNHASPALEQASNMLAPGAHTSALGTATKKSPPASCTRPARSAWGPPAAHASCASSITAGLRGARAGQGEARPGRCWTRGWGGAGRQ